MVTRAYVTNNTTRLGCCVGVGSEKVCLVSAEFTVARCPSTAILGTRLSTLVGGPVCSVDESTLGRCRRRCFTGGYGGSGRRVRRTGAVVPNNIRRGLTFGCPFPVIVMGTGNGELCSISNGRCCSFLRTNNPAVVNSGSSIMESGIVRLLRSYNPSANLFRPCRCGLTGGVSRYIPSIRVFHVLNSNARTYVYTIHMTHLTANRGGIVGVNNTCRN